MFDQASVRWSTGTLGLLTMLFMHLLVLQLTWQPSMASDDDPVTIKKIIAFIEEFPHSSEEEIADYAQDMVSNQLPGLLHAELLEGVQFVECVVHVYNSSDFETCNKTVWNTYQNASNDTEQDCSARFAWLRCATKASCSLCSDKAAQISYAIADAVSFELSNGKCQKWTNQSLKPDDLVCIKNGTKLKPLFPEDMTECVKLTANATKNCIALAHSATVNITDDEERSCKFIGMVTECEVPQVCQLCSTEISHTYITLLEAAEPTFHEKCKQWNIASPQFYCDDWSPDPNIVDEIADFINNAIGVIKGVKIIIDQIMFKIKDKILPGVIDIIQRINECPEKVANSTDFQTCKKEAEGNHTDDTSENKCKLVVALTKCFATSSCKLCSVKQVQVAQLIIDAVLAGDVCQDYPDDLPKTAEVCNQNGTDVPPLISERMVNCVQNHKEEINKCVDIAKNEVANVKDPFEKVCKFTTSAVSCTKAPVCELCESGTSEDYFKLLEDFEVRAKKCAQKNVTEPVQLTCPTKTNQTTEWPHSDHHNGNETTKRSGMATWLIVTIILLVVIVIGAVIGIFICMKDDKKEQPSASGKAQAEAKTGSTTSAISAPKASSQIKQGSTVASSAVGSKVASKVGSKVGSKMA